jgi:LacI family transcriptional regulator
MPKNTPPLPSTSPPSPPVLRKPATLAEVGKLAGVSVMAVSSVLNGARSSARISAKTRERILEAASQLNYRPNAAARALLRQRMDAIGVAAVVDAGELNYYFLEVLGGVLEAAARFTQNVTVFTLRDWNREADRIADFCDGRIDGLILVAPVIIRPNPRVFPSYVPLVSLHANSLLPGVNDIESDEKRGSAEIIRALIERGHRRILHLAGPPDFKGARLRLEGYLEALAEAGIARDDSLIVPSGYTQKNGYESILKWMVAHRGEALPTAVFCCNDGCAVGCLEGLAAQGVRVPAEISLAGFDDTLASRTSVPQIATVRQPLVEMAGLAVELLLHPEMRASQEAPLILPTKVLLRQSIGPAPANPSKVP